MPLGIHQQQSHLANKYQENIYSLQITEDINPIFAEHCVYTVVKLVAFSHGQAYTSAVWKHKMMSKNALLFSERSVIAWEFPAQFSHGQPHNSTVWNHKRISRAVQPDSEDAK